MTESYNHDPTREGAFCRLLRILKPALLVAGGILLFSVISCQQKLEDNELAKIEDLSVTEKHFVSAFKEYYYRSGRSLTPTKRNKRAVLENEFSPYVLTVYARERGWNQDRQSHRRLGMIRRKVYAEEYRERFVLDTVSVTERDLRTLFMRLNTTLRASHLYTSDREEADSLYRAIQNGASFEKLAARTFKNRYLAENGGDVGTFSVNDLDPAFENTAYNLEVGEISPPVKTNQGYSIIKLTERYRKPIMTESEFAARKGQIRSLARKQAEEMATRQHLSRVVENLQIDRDLVKQLWSRVSDQKERFWSLQPERESMQLDIGPLSDKDFAGTPDFALTGTDILREAYFTPAESRSRINGEFDFLQYVQGIAFRSYVINQFRESSAIDDPAVQGSIDQTFYNYLNNRVVDTLRDNIQPSEEELRKEFKRHPSQYKKPLEINLARIVVSSKAEGKRVLAKLQQGHSFTRVLREHSMNSEDLMTDGELGYQSIRNLGPMAPKVKEMKPGEYSGPHEYHSNKFYIYKCLGRKEPRMMSFEEARNKVEETLRQKMLKKKKKELIERTKKQHDALMNLEKLENFTLKI